MNDKKNLAIGILVAVLAYDTAVHLNNRKIYKKQLATIKSLKQQKIDLVGKLKYALGKLDNYEVPVTEFDYLVASFYDN